MINNKTYVDSPKENPKNIFIFYVELFYLDILFSQFFFILFIEMSKSYK